MAPEVEDRFDFDARELLPREFLLANWRSRVGDLPIRLPYRDTPAAPARPSVLWIEHWSRPQLLMPVRSYLYAALRHEELLKSWETALQAWRQRDPAGSALPRPELELEPIWSVAYNTGPSRWLAHRTLSEIHNYPPGWPGTRLEWSPTLWELSAFTPETLLAVRGAYPAALAVVRALERGEGNVERVFRAACGRILALPDAEGVRRCDLIWFTLSYVGYRRGEAEERRMMAVAEALAPSYAVREEVREVNRSVELTWFEQMRQHGEAEGLAKGRQVGLAEGRQGAILDTLSLRFGEVSNDIGELVRRVRDLERLRDLQRLSVTAPDLEVFHRELAGSERSSHPQAGGS
jgi:hypothetical protein